MLIVSQTHKTVVTLSSIESFVVGNDYTIRAFVQSFSPEEDNYYEIAEYESESRAKRVLESLWSAYANGEKVFFMPEK